MILEKLFFILRREEEGLNVWGRFGLVCGVPVGRLSEAGALALTAEEGEMVVVQLVVDAVLHNVLQ
jgi:hypothetical protein